MRNRWIGIILVVAFALLAATAPYWLPPLLDFAGTNANTIQGLTKLVLLVL